MKEMLNNRHFIINDNVAAAPMRTTISYNVYLIHPHKQTAFETVNLIKKMIIARIANEVSPIRKGWQQVYILRT